MKEITEIDEKKYVVIKREDIEKYIIPMGLSEAMNSLLGIITLSRKIDRKPMFNKYLVLNMDDEIDWKYLTDWHDVVHPDYRKLKVRDIAVALVNAVLKAKDDDSES